MAKNDNLIIKIDAYIKGHLSKEETTAFEKEMAADADLSQQVAQQRLHLEALDILLEDDLRTKMDAWQIENDAADKPKNWRVWGLGLLIIPIAAGLYFLLKPKNEPPLTTQQNGITKDSSAIKPNEIPKTNSDTLQKQLNSPILPQKKTPLSIPRVQGEKPIATTQTLPNDLLTATNEDLGLVLTELENNITRQGTQTDTLLSETYRFIRQKEYAKALNTLKNVSDTEGALARAITYFLNGQYAQALPIFENLANNKGFDRLEMAEYYAALCLFTNGQKQVAVQRLTKIAADKEHAYSNKAKKDLKSLGY